MFQRFCRCFSTLVFELKTSLLAGGAARAKDVKWEAGEVQKLREVRALTMMSGGMVGVDGHRLHPKFRSAVLPPQVFDELRRDVEHHLVQVGRHRTIMDLHQQKLRHEVQLHKMRGAAASAAARGSGSSGEEWFEEAPRAAQAPPKRSHAEIEEDLSDWADMFASGSDDSSDSEEDEDDARRVRVRDIDGLIDDEPIPLAHQPHPAHLHAQAHVSASPSPAPPTPCLSNKQN